MEKIRLLIADDHILIREGLRHVLSIEPSIKVLAEVGDGAEAVAYTLVNQVDIVLMDINMPNLNGIEACRLIKEKKPATAVIALTIHNQEEYLFELLRAGVSAYILKDVSPDELINTITGVYRGQSYLPPSLTRRVMEEFNRLASNPSDRPYGLTAREMEVLKEVARGSSNKEIAANLHISEKTVKNHLTNIFLKMDVSDRTQAALLAVKSKLA
ncbi:MAG: response regulator transcription factor [Bacillota bacterium]